MMLSTRTLTQTLAALAIAASTVGGVLYGATAAYANHVDSGQALMRGHRMVAHSALSHTQRQFLTRVHCPACRHYHLEVSLQHDPALYGRKEATTMKARRQDATAVEAAVLARMLSAILAPYRLGHMPIHHCDMICMHH